MNFLLLKFWFKKWFKKKNYKKTGRFFKMTYPNQKDKIRIGDRVIVHPSSTSMSRVPFEATIVKHWVNWADTPCYELCTYVKDGYHAVMNDYLYQRLEKI